jgi:hypothetical protein
VDDLTGALDCAFAHQQRWYAYGDVADAEEAIRGWQAALDVPGGDWAAANCGVLLVERAYRRHDPADAVEATRLLESSATAAGDDPVAAQRWYQLGNAHLARWLLGDEPCSLQAILRCQETALRHNRPIPTCSC